LSVEGSGKKYILERGHHITVERDGRGNEIAGTSHEQPVVVKQKELMQVDRKKLFGCYSQERELPWGGTKIMPRWEHSNSPGETTVV